MCPPTTTSPCGTNCSACATSGRSSPHLTRWHWPRTGWPPASTSPVSACPPAGGRRVCPHQAWRPQHLPRPAGAEPLDWTRAAQLEELVQYYHGLLEIRKAYPELSGMAGDAEPCILSLPGWLIGFVPERQAKSLPGGWPFIITRSAPASGGPACRELALSVRWYPCPPPEPFGPACRNAHRTRPPSA